MSHVPCVADEDGAGFYVARVLVDCSEECAGHATQPVGVHGAGRGEAERGRKLGNDFGEDVRLSSVSSLSLCALLTNAPSYRQAAVPLCR